MPCSFDRNYTTTKLLALELVEGSATVGRISEPQVEPALVLLSSGRAGLPESLGGHRELLATSCFDVALAEAERQVLEVEQCPLFSVRLETHLPFVVVGGGRHLSNSIGQSWLHAAGRCAYLAVVVVIVFVVSVALVAV